MILNDQHISTWRVYREARRGTEVDCAPIPRERAFDAKTRLDAAATFSRISSSALFFSAAFAAFDFAGSFEGGFFFFAPPVLGLKRKD